MKKLVGMILSAGLLTALTGAETIVDGFDTKAWEHWQSAESKGAFGYEKEIGKSQSGAARLTLMSGNPDNASQLFLNTFPGEAGKSYRMTLFVRADAFPASGKVSLSAQGMGENQQFLAVIKSVKIGNIGTEWKKMSLHFTVPVTGDLKKTKFIRCLFGASGADSGVVYFDDFKLEELDMNDGYTDSFDLEKWDTWKGDKAKGEFLHNPTIGRTDPGALEIKLGADNPLNNTLSFLKHFPVVPGKTYTFLVYVKNGNLPPEATIGLSTQGQDKNLKFLGTGVQGTRITARDCSDDWKRMVFTFKVPTTGKWIDAGNLLLTLAVGNSAEGNVYFDDFEFFEEETDAE